MIITLILLGIICILFYIGYDYERKLYTWYWTKWWAKQSFYIMKAFVMYTIAGVKLVLRWVGLYKGDI